MKTCKVCGVSKALDQFVVKDAKRGRFSSRCKSCDKAYYAEHYKENAERKKRQALEYYEANRAQVRAKQGEYYRRNATILKVYQKKLRANPLHAFVKDERSKQWRKANPEYGRAYVNARRKRIKTVTPRWANMARIMAVYRDAARLTKETGIKHHVDHIVPIKSDRVCGLHWEGNLQVMPASDNIRKHNREWPDM